MAEENRRAARAGRRPARGPARTGREGMRAARARRPRTTLRERADSAAGAVRAHPLACGALAVLLVVLLALYGPTRDYYLAFRSGQDLQAYYQAIVEQNESLDQDIDRLMSEEGVEDEARKRGYTKGDETIVVVENLPEEDLSDLLGQVVVEDNRPWYIRVLDVIFRYERQNWQ